MEDLDQQVEEKKELRDKAQRFRETNEMASKLSKFNLNEPVISVNTFFYDELIKRGWFLHGNGPEIIKTE